MCNGFGCLVVKNAEGEGFTLKFSEPDSAGNCSHSEILARLGWEDNQDQFNRRFVRVEFHDWTESSFHFDEDYSLPAWVHDDWNDIHHSCEKLMLRAKKVYEKYAEGFEEITDEYTASYRALISERDLKVAKIYAEYESLAKPINDAQRAALTAAIDKYNRITEEPGCTQDETYKAYEEYNDAYILACNAFSAAHDPIYRASRYMTNEAFSYQREKLKEASDKRDAAYIDAIKSMAEDMSAISGYVPARVKKGDK